MVAVGRGGGRGGTRSATTVAAATTSSYLCYLLISSSSTTSRLGKTYVGITNNLPRRVRQHNGELVGGARATRSGRPWDCLLTIEGFQTHKQSLQFEWMWKHMPPKKSHGLTSRLTKLQSLLRKKRWTENSPLASTIPLVVTLYPTTASIPQQHKSKLKSLQQLLLLDDDNKNDDKKQQKTSSSSSSDELLPNYIQIIQQTNNKDDDL